MLFHGNKAKLHENKFSDGAAMGLAPNYNCFVQPTTRIYGYRPVAPAPFYEDVFYKMTNPQGLGL